MDMDKTHIQHYRMWESFLFNCHHGFFPLMRAGCYDAIRGPICRNIFQVQRSNSKPIRAHDMNTQMCIRSDKVLVKVIDWLVGIVIFERKTNAPSTIAGT